MATWIQAKELLTKKYPAKVNEDLKELGFDNLEIEFKTTENRTQSVIIQKIPFGVEWLQVLSGIGEIPPNKLEYSLERCLLLPFGGIVSLQGLHFLRESLPLDDLTPERLINVIETIVRFADQLEKDFVGGDEN